MLSERADHPPLALDGDFDRIGFDVRDLHGRAEKRERFAFNLGVASAPRKRVEVGRMLW
jgi:hypothetical protein